MYIYLNVFIASNIIYYVTSISYLFSDSSC